MLRVESAADEIHYIPKAAVQVLSKSLSMYVCGLEERRSHDLFWQKFHVKDAKPYLDAKKHLQLKRNSKVIYVFVNFSFEDGPSP